MNKDKILKFNKYFDPISFIYIVLVYNNKSNKYIFYCFIVFYIIEKLILLWYLKDNDSKKKLIFHSLIALAYIVVLIYVLITFARLI